jgi:hypothetical protein
VGGFGVGAESEAFDGGEKDCVFGFPRFPCQGSGREKGHERKENGVEVMELHCRLR